MLGRGKKNYLICSSHRAGSSLLREAIRRSASCGDPAPFLSPHYALDLFESARVTSHPGSDFPAYFREVLAAQLSKNSPFGLTATWQNLEDFPLRMGAPCAAADHRQLARTLLAHLGPTRFIWCRREDKVRQAISFLKAKQSHLHPIPHPLRFDFPSLHALAARFQHEELTWQTFFKTNRIRPLVVTYESFAPDFHLTISRTLKFLGARRSPVPDPIPNKPPADSTSDTWFRLYHEELAKNDPAS